MCHGHDARRWMSTVDEESEEADDEPAFLDDEPAEDVELLTDGGDD